jgi:hypothetical protein
MFIITTHHRIMIAHKTTSVFSSGNVLEESLPSIRTLWLSDGGRANSAGRSNIGSGENGSLKFYTVKRTEQ